MKARPTPISRALTAVLLSSGLVLGAASIHAQPYGDGGRGHGPRAEQMTEADRAQKRERMQQRMNQRLDHMAQRLDIKASQQGVWDEYRRTITSIFAQERPQRPGRDADAATVIRFRADMTLRRAQHLATVADATAKLQQALDADQRKTLDEFAHRMGSRGSRGGHGHGFGPGR